MILTQGPDLLSRTEVTALVNQVKALAEESGFPLAAVVFDTMSRSAPGADENSSQDMGEIVGSCDYIREETGAAVVLVHHTGKDKERGPRGHSSLFAAADTVICVADGVATLEKSRDGVSGERFPFELVSPASAGFHFCC